MGEVFQEEWVEGIQSWELFKYKDVNQVTGLGLSISKCIIHDHGGELSFYKIYPRQLSELDPLRKINLDS